MDKNLEMKNIVLIIVFSAFYSINMYGDVKLLSTFSHADSIVPDVNTIRVNSAYFNGKIRIRWMTTQMEVWEHALKVGYTIERLTIKSNGVYLSQQERLNSFVVIKENYRPKAEADLVAASSNPNEGLLANKLINEPNTQESILTVAGGSNTLEKAVQQKKMRDNRYFFTHILAEKSFEMASAMGMAYEDATIEVGKQYAYIVTLSEPLN